MQQITVNSDWLPIDQWIADALENSMTSSRIEEDLIDCVLFWSGKYARKGSSSYDSLAKSLEVVRILVSLGIDTLSGSNNMSHLLRQRLRELFKAPFSELKASESSSAMDSILGWHSSSNDKDKQMDLSLFWETEKRNTIDQRLYAMVRGNFETALAKGRTDKEISSILKRLSRITEIPLGATLDSYLEENLIRTLFAMHLTGIKRPTKLRKSLSNYSDSALSSFEPLNESEIIRVRDVVLAPAVNKLKIEDKFRDLIEKLDISDCVLCQIFGPQPVSWTNYISGMCFGANQNVEEASFGPLEIFTQNFVCNEVRTDIKTYEYNDLNEDLKHIFTNTRSSDSTKKELLILSGLGQTELDSLLNNGVKMGLVKVTKVNRKNLYSLIELDNENPK